MLLKAIILVHAIPESRSGSILHRRGNGCRHWWVMEPHRFERCVVVHSGYLVLWRTRSPRRIADERRATGKRLFFTAFCVLDVRPPSSCCSNEPMSIEKEQTVCAKQRTASARCRPCIYLVPIARNREVMIIRVGHGGKQERQTGWMSRKMR